jgi:hypothetical protein
VGFSSVETAPSPKSHLYDAAPVVLLVNVTVYASTDVLKLTSGLPSTVSFLQDGNSNPEDIIIKKVFIDFMRLVVLRAQCICIDLINRQIINDAVIGIWNHHVSIARRLL